MTLADAVTAVPRRDRLPLDFYARDVAVVARELLGCALVHGDRAMMIVETEAYGGPEDAASHARFGKTARTAPMFGRAGHAYVYLCYGTHEMFNIVAGTRSEDDVASAVLIRAVAPLDEADAPTRGNGPGKLTALLGLHRGHSGRDLTFGDLYVAAWQAPPAIAVGPRVGVAYAGRWARAPLRFAWHRHPHVSRPAPSRRWRA